MNPITRRRTRGFTLIELMIGITLLGILLVFAYPSYTSFIRNSQIRTAAESVLNGLQLARAEAIRRNSNVQFVLLNEANSAATPGGTDWVIRAPNADSPGGVEDVQTRRENATSAIGARIGAATATSATPAAPGAKMPATIAFTALGRLTTATTIRQIDITGAEGTRNLTIVLAPGGDVRLCDPNLSLATNPQGCS